MKVAVTGAQGYLGRSLVPAIAAHPGVEEVLAIDARGDRAGGGKLRALQRDVRDPALERDLQGVDVLVHLAFVVLGTGADAPSVNIDGSRNAFACALGADVSTIVHASSAAAYGSAPDNPIPLAEGRPLRALPPFYYPQTKVAVERMLDELERQHPDLRVVRMRPVSTLGPGAPRIAGGRAFVMPSDHDPLMQFTWIDDVTAAFLSAIGDSRARGPYNVGAPGPVPCSEVASSMGVRSVRLPYRVLRAAATAGAALRLRGAMHPGWVDIARYPIVVDTGRIERELGWRASCDCRAALRRYGELLRAGAERSKRIAISPSEAG